MQRLLITMTVGMIGLWANPARAQCPAAIPAPADAFHVQCFTINKPVATRCATFITPDECTGFNNAALNAGLLTADGFAELERINFCAINFPPFPGAPPRIFDFCPEGCFAADTQILSTVSSFGEANYVAAESLSPKSPLMSLADTASFDEIVLAQASTKQVVKGPEEAELFVFALANGRYLRVTMNHPMVLDNGQIIEAHRVQPKMAFVGLDGRSVAINSITREQPTADVYNFDTGGATDMSHIIVAEGVLTGDLKIQNALKDEQGEIERRR